MDFWRNCLILAGLIMMNRVSGQSTDDILREFQLHYDRAQAYSEISLYGPCLEELNLAIEYASRHQLEQQRIDASITLAEVMRKTQDFEKGLNLLLELDKTTAYPRLHVRKLGRIAAIYNEWPISLRIDQTKIVLFYLDSALQIANKFHFLPEEASLYNEKGYTISSKNRALGLSYLQKSAEMYKSLRDTHNYVSAMTNTLRSYIVLGDSAKSHAIINNLLSLVKDRHWYTAEVELYNLVSLYHKTFKHDLLAAGYWVSKADKSMISNLSSINSTQMSAFRSIYETKKLKDQVASMELQQQLKQEALDRQKKRTRELFVFLSLLVLLIVLVIALLIRERRLKTRLKSANNQLQVSNERYQVLMVESNHRIKNNLQMVISMIEYSGNQSNEDVQAAFKRMSGKIYTISALHKHLTADVHNELVAMDVYFNEMLKHYHGIAHFVPVVVSNISPVKIKSERMVYFGLILNEMITNTIAHGKTRNHAVKINVETNVQGYRFDYRDGSVHDPDASQGTGSVLIRQLVQRVGGSGFKFDAATGHYQFHFYA